MFTEAAHRDIRETQNRRVQSILESNRSWSGRYKHLMNMLESNDPRMNDIAKRTLMVMDNQAMFMEKVAKDKRLESTFTTALGQLVPRIVDVVRIFYPNLIAQDLVDIQPMDRQNGEIFFVKPIFSNSAAGVTAGDEVFKTQTNGFYASENIVSAIGTGDGTDTTWGSTLAPQPVRPGTFKLFVAGTQVATDNGQGAIAGSGITGTINYSTGVWSVTFTTAPAAAAAITSHHRYDSEQQPSQVREVELKLGTLPITAEPHPLRINFSTQAELAASSHLDLDVGDILTNLVASLIKNERDLKLAASIYSVATPKTELNFDATPPSNYSRLARYAEIEAKLDFAESEIQRTQGRGGVSFVMAGNNAANIFRHSTGFEPSDIVAPIGPHKIGTLRDGTVSVIKVPTMDPNAYVVGFKGYVVGDAATILGEWIPLYASPLFRSYDMNNYQGMMSLYALVQNNTGYYLRGTVSGYAA